MEIPVLWDISAKESCSLEWHQLSLGTVLVAELEGRGQALWGNQLCLQAPPLDWERQGFLFALPQQRLRPPCS